MPSPAPLFPARASRLVTRRSAISLTEVLIAMGIMTVGLLGVAALIPVGGWYVQKTAVADRGSAIAQSVMSDLVTRGMLNPWAWYVMVPAPAPKNNSPLGPNYQYRSNDGKNIDGKYAGLASGFDLTFTRPFAETLSAGLKVNSDKTVLTKQFGSAYVIDPMYAAAAASTTSPQPQNNVAAYPFPATAYQNPWSWPYYYKNAAWDPWRGSDKDKEKTWPIRRVTFQGVNGLPLDKAIAENFCRINDDLATELPARADRPAMQKLEATSAQAPLTRQWTGDYSWITTVVPTTIAARDGMAQNPGAFAYEVSVVVFYKRSLPTAPPSSTTEMLDVASHERMVGAKIISTGISGGELLLTDMQDIANVNPFDQLKVGQWIMLCGPHPNSNAYFDNATGSWKGESRFFLNWYQVLSITGKEERLNNVGTTSPAPAANEPARRVIAVRGAQWPWQPATNLTAANISNDLCVGIFRGAVAVHSKTLNLESPTGGPFGTGMSFFVPVGVTDRNVLY